MPCADDANMSDIGGLFPIKLLPRSFGSDCVDRVRQLIITDPAVTCRGRNVRMSHGLLNRCHADASSV